MVVVHVCVVARPEHHADLVARVSLELVHDELAVHVDVHLLMSDYRVQRTFDGAEEDVAVLQLLHVVRQHDVVVDGAVLQLDRDRPELGVGAHITVGDIEEDPQCL